MSNLERTNEITNKLQNTNNTLESIMNKLLLFEYKYVQLFCPSGVYCIPTYDDMRKWEGVIFVKDGVYKNGIFKFNIIIPGNYPDAHPQLYFKSKVYNPRIDLETGELDLKKRFPTWTCGKNIIVNMLLYVKDIFYNTNISRDSESFNREAGNLFITNYQNFEERVIECVEESRKKENLIEEENYYEIRRNSFDPEKFRVDESLQTQENIDASFNRKEKRVFFEEETHHSRLILEKLKGEFSVSKSLMAANSSESVSAPSAKDEKNPYDEINKKAEEFTKWFLSDYLERVKNSSNNQN